jgi:hypothetical protein
MAVAALFHWRFGFFMNWFGKKQGQGVEYHILANRDGPLTNCERWRDARSQARIRPRPERALHHRRVRSPDVAR